jgi:hypothetical protein
VRITLPTGAWVDVKDSTSPGDRFAIQDSVDLVVEDGKTYIRGAASSQYKAFLSRLITGWSYEGVPIPSQNLSVLEEYPPDEDDANALEDALQERYDRLVRRRPTARTKPSATSGTSQSS